MADQANSTSTGSSLDVPTFAIGNAFVKQYYNAMHECPQDLHRFYTDESRLTRAEAGVDGDEVDTIVSKFEIRRKFMALDYGDLKAEIVTVDSQESLMGGVLVLVTGSLSSRLRGKRKFVQSFFLTRQEKAYCVLNDVCRYLDEEPESSKATNILANDILQHPQLQLHVESDRGTSLQPVEHEELDVESDVGPVEHEEVHLESDPGTSSPVEREEPHTESDQEVPSLSLEHEGQEIPPPSMQEVEMKMEEIFDTREHVELSEIKDDGQIKNLSSTETAPGSDEASSPIPALPVPVPSIEETSEEAPTKSYASILRMKENTNSAPFTTCNITSKASTSSMERLAPSSCSPTTTITRVILNGRAPMKTKVGRSVYVRNLPMTILSSNLEEEFRKFGTLKPGGVSVKSHKQGGVSVNSDKQGSCYAFVEFEKSISAQKAIASSPISICGRPVYVAEKRLAW